MDGEKRQQNMVNQLGNTHMKILAARSDVLSIHEKTNYTKKITWNSSTNDVESFPSSGTVGFNDDIQVRKTIA
jgi:hypothetical protein